MNAPRVAPALFLAVLALASPLAAQTPSPAVRKQVAPGSVVVRVVLVATDHSLKPIPRQAFAIVPEGSGEPVEARTDFEGTFTLSLAPGRYQLHSRQAVAFEGTEYTWDVPFAIETGAQARVDLSNDNAKASTAPPAAGKPEAEGDLYRRLSPGVFKVIADGGHGSAFLIGQDGLIVTNHHVIAEATYLAVLLDSRNKHAAVVLAQDASRDIAILRVHPDVVAGRPVLELAPDAADAPAVAVGDKVLAIGSPLTTDTIMTMGLVSKVEADSIFSDVSINPGNSGGPLFDARGRVVGISTFGMGGKTGQGISGIVRIHRAAGAIAAARERLAQGVPPDPRKLPVEDAYRFVPEALRELALQRAPEPEKYHLEAGKMDVYIVTPVLLANAVVQSEREAAKGRAKRRKEKQPDPQDKPGQQFYEWQKDTDNFRPVARIVARPETKAKMGSTFRALIGGALAFAFKTDFEKMELKRGAEVIEPILPARIKQVVHMEGAATMKDIGYFGYYEYPPEAFEGSAPITLTVWEQGIETPKVLVLSPEMVAMIRGDFAPYLERQGKAAK